MLQWNVENNLTAEVSSMKGTVPEQESRDGQANPIRYRFSIFDTIGAEIRSYSGILPISGRA